MNIMSENLVYLSGKFVPFNEILAPLSLYAYGAYTSIKYTPGGLLFLDKHLSRLKYNCQELNIPYPSDEKIINAIKRTLDQNDSCNKEVIVRVTLFPETISWANPQSIKDTPCAILVTTREIYYLPQNYSLKTVNLSRHLPHLKTITYTVNFMAKAKAKEAGFHDALFLNDKAHITEGTSWNIFLIKDSKVYTPSLESGLLEGITRGAIIKICNQLNIELLLEKIPVKEIGQFDAAFITNATQGPHAVMKIDDFEYDIKNKTLMCIKEEYSKFPLTKLA